MSPKNNQKEKLNYADEFLTSLGADLAFELGDEGRDYDLFLKLIENSKGIKEEPFGVLEEKMENIGTNDEVREILEKIIYPENVEKLINKLVRMREGYKSDTIEKHGIFIIALSEMRQEARGAIKNLKLRSDYKLAAEMALIWLFNTNLI